MSSSTETGIETGGTQWALSIDLERCLGCRSCEAACKLENQLGSDVARNRVLWLQGETAARLDFVNAVCQQCERPACVRACAHQPKALSKDPRDGIVRVDARLCTGCQECVKACPYNAIAFDFRRQKAEKCDLCAGRRNHGMKPACVAACPGRALNYGPLEELLAQAESDGRRRRIIDHFGQNPSTVYLERTLGWGDGERGRRGDGDGLGPGTPNPEPRTAGVPLPPSYAPVVSREGRGLNHGRRGRGAGFLGKLPRLAYSEEIFPYSGAPRIWEADRVAEGGCNLCFNSCTTRYYFKQDRLIAVTGNEDDPVLQGRVCAKAQMQLQQFYSPHRLIYPMKRVGNRGEGKFRRIGWEEALDEVATKLKEVRDRYGAESVGIYAGNRNGTLTVNGMVPMFAEMFGTPNRGESAPFCGTSSDVAWTVVQGTKGSGNSYTPGDIGSAQMYLIVGDNMGETRPVYFGALNDWRLQNRARMVVVDPRLSVTASKADEWVQIRPGTDMALALAMMHYLLAEDLVDHAFVDRWVLGYAEVRRFILEMDYSARWAEGVTDIPAATIERLAREYAVTERAMVHLNRGLTQHSNGVQTVRAFHMLCALTGHWGREGAGCMTISNGLPLGARTPAHRVAPAKRPGLRRSPASWIEAMDSGRPYPLRAMIMSTNPLVFWPDQQRLRQAIQKLELVVHLELWPNESSAWADYLFPGASSIEMGEVNRICEDRRLVWIDKLIDPPGEARPDTHFWIDLGKRFGFDDVLRDEYKDSARFWDECMLADPRMKGMTVERLRRAPHKSARGPLPTEEHEEKDTLFEEGCVYPGDSQGRRFPTPSGKLELWTPDLEQRFGAVGLTALPEFYAEPQSLIPLPHLEMLSTDADEGVPSPFWPGFHANAARIVYPEAAPRSAALPPSSPEAVPQGAAVPPSSPEAGVQGAAVPPSSPEAGVQGAAGPMAGFGVSPNHPSISLPPRKGEGPGMGVPSSFDTELVTGRPPAPHFHSWTHFWWGSQEMWPDLYLQIHPEKAASLGISDGDRVAVESPHGAVEAVAWVYPGIRTSCVYMPIGWGERQPYNGWRGTNWLISKETRDPASDQTNFKSTLCRIRKA